MVNGVPEVWAFGAAMNEWQNLAEEWIEAGLLNYKLGKHCSPDDFDAAMVLLNRDQERVETLESRLATLTEHWEAAGGGGKVTLVEGLRASGFNIPKTWHLETETLNMSLLRSSTTERFEFPFESTTRDINSLNAWELRAVLLVEVTWGPEGKRNVDLLEAIINTARQEWEAAKNFRLKFGEVIHKARTRWQDQSP